MQTTQTTKGQLTRLALQLAERRERRDAPPADDSFDFVGRVEATGTREEWGFEPTSESTDDDMSPESAE
jgi:hypothetical protein